MSTNEVSGLGSPGRCLLHGLAASGSPRAHSCRPCCQCQLFEHRDLTEWAAHQGTPLSVAVLVQGVHLLLVESMAAAMKITSSSC